MPQIEPTEILPPDPNREKKEAICRFLEEGAFFQDAAVLAGVGRRTAYDWREADRTFRTQVRLSIEIYKQKLVSIVNHGSIKSPGLALDMLKIRWRDQYNPPQEVVLKSSEDKIKEVQKLIKDNFKETDEPVSSNGSHMVSDKNRGTVPADAGTEPDLPGDL